MKKQSNFKILAGSFSLGGLKAGVAWMLSSRHGSSRYVCVANVHTLVTSMWDRDLKSANDRADLVVPDGKPLSVCGRLMGHATAGQARGADLMLQTCRQGRKQGMVHYFFGGAEGVSEAAARSLKYLAPGLKVAGAESPPFRALTTRETSRLTRRLRSRRVAVLWVGLGAPKQEKWMAAMKGKIPCTMVGVGAAFDFFAGTVAEAPRLWQKLGLEWFYRLAMEPGRLWKRYLQTIPIFLLLFLVQYFGFCYNSSSRPVRGLKILGFLLCACFAAPSGWAFRVLALVTGLGMPRFAHQIDRFREGRSL
jgi:N-acetylglucosaminyldiphosphoundecaprenol N-acetyl-beta-D-mannosaminyltransferase